MNTEGDGCWPSSAAAHSHWFSAYQARAGFMLNIIGVLVIMLAINSWAFPIFNLHTFPSWAYTNSTHCMASQPNTTLSNL